MTAHGSLRAVMLVCCLLALGTAGAGVAAEKPSPQELWKLYPLDPSRGERPAGTKAAEERPAATTPAKRGTAPRAGTTTAAKTPPAATTEAEPQPAPRGGVAGASTTRPAETGSAEATGAASDSGTPLSFGLLLGGLFAALLMLGAAALPERAIPRLGGVVGDRRLEMALAGTLTLLVVTIVYVSTSFS
jgi:cobalamin biosynthesis Mg chelatase CobN